MRRRGKRRDPPTAAAAGRSRRRTLAVAAVVCAGLALAWVTRRPATEATATPASGAESGPSPSAASGSAPASTTPTPFAPFVGDWLRPDGGYQLSVAGVTAEGKATVAYFNPRSIRVARAEARRESERGFLFVEFDDVNYPGSTYTLAYDPVDDTLKGVYFQAVQRESYDVVFVRRR